MKRLNILLLIFSALIGFALAQSPEKINFQTVIRDNMGVPMANQNLDLRISVTNGPTAPYRTYYQEVFSGLTTDDFGLINVHIGTGTPDLTNYGAFTQVAWGKNNLHIMIEVNTGNGYVNLGPSELVSVPHALHSNVADSVQNVSLNQLENVNAANASDGQVLMYNQLQDQWIPAQGNGNSLWSQNGSKIYYSIDNVGIGTSNPGAGLTLGSTKEFAFATHFNPASQRDLLSLFGTSTFETDNFTGLGYETELYFNGGQQAPLRVLYAKAQGGHRWYIKNNANGGSDASMTLNRDGFLGLGIENAKANIHVNNYTRITNSSPYGSFMVGTSSWLALAMDRDEIQAYNSNAIPSVLRLQRNGGDLSLCAGNGDVGIGTDAPKSRLQIAIGNDAATGSNTNHGFLMLGETSGANVIMDNNEIMARNGTTATQLRLQADGGSLSMGALTGSHLLFNYTGIQAKLGNTNGPLIMQGSGGDILACATNDGQMAIGGGLSTTAKLNIQDNGWQMRINNPDTGGQEWFIGSSDDGWAASGGKLIFGKTQSSTAGILVLNAANDGVGIGTTDVPSNYKLAVKGRVICEELRVRDSNLWPDYVFEDNYKLRSLEEVEAHIEENNHLPGIPAAAEVEAEGIAVGEMQKMMMEKIEELTLYVIDQNKQLKAQQERIKQLETELKNH